MRARVSSVVAMPVRGDLSVQWTWGWSLVKVRVGRRAQRRPNQGCLIQQSLVLQFKVNCTGGWAQRAPSDSPDTVHKEELWCWFTGNVLQVHAQEDRAF